MGEGVFRPQSQGRRSLPAGQMSLPLWARLTCIRPERQGKVTGLALHAIRSHQPDISYRKFTKVPFD
jgi:hypothetical protein